MFGSDLQSHRQKKKNTGVAKTLLSDAGLKPSQNVILSSRKTSLRFVSFKVQILWYI